MRLLRQILTMLLFWAAALPASASFHLWGMSELYSNADGTVQFLEFTTSAGGQQFLGGHTLTSQSGAITNTFNFSNLPGDTTNKKFLVGTTGFAALGVVTPDFIVPNGFFFQGGGTITFASGVDVWTHGALPAPPLSLNRDGSTSTNSPRNFAGQTGSISSQPPPPPPGGSSAKTLGSRATVTPAVTLFGGFELTSASTVYILVRGNSLGTLGVTQSFLDSPRVRLFNSQGQDLLTDAGVAGFTGCSSANSGTAVVNYYANVRGQPAHARDGCTAQSLAAGVYTFTVTPSTTGSVSAPSSGEVLFEVTLGGGSGSITKTLGSRATVSPSATLFGGFELAVASTVYVLVRGNSLGTLGVTQSFLDSPRVRLFNGAGQDLITDGGVAGFTGCSSTANSGAAVVTYYANVRGQPAHARDGCTAQTLAAGVYTFNVTPSTTGSISAPATGEVLFEVTLSQ